MKKLSAEKVIFSFSAEHEPVMAVDVPVRMEIQTKDCFFNQLREPEDKVDQIDWDVINPATGPVYINGAEPGDTLKVTINEIDLDEKGCVCCMEGEGTLGDQIEGTHVRIVPIENGEAVFSDDIRISVDPMIGVIGVAPEGHAVNTGTPGKHGGNMDNTMIRKGAVLYLPVAAEGALFALGDVHAVMGDGEIGVTGLEIPAHVDVTLELIKGGTPEYPVLEDPEHISVIVSAETTDEASEKAADLMKDILYQKTGMSVPDIIMLMSLVGDLQFCQIVDPLKTVRFVFPKKYMK